MRSLFRPRRASGTVQPKAFRKKGSNAGEGRVLWGLRPFLMPLRLTQVRGIGILGSSAYSTHIQPKNLSHAV